jgi:hypothetical protein
VSRAQRLTFLAVAVVIAVIAVVVLTSGGSDDEETESAGATATPTATATATPEETGAPEETATPTMTAKPKPQPPLLESGTVTKIRFEQGETVRFRVRSDIDEEIHVHGFDHEETVPAGKTVTVSFPAEITGIFEIEFHGSGEQIGQLRVDPG